MSSPLRGSCGGDLEAAGDFLRGSSPKWVFVVRALVTVKGTGAAKDELNKM
jgi:hypothetical protein